MNNAAPPSQKVHRLGGGRWQGKNTYGRCMFHVAFKSASKRKYKRTPTLQAGCSRPGESVFLFSASFKTDANVAADWSHKSDSVLHLHISMGGTWIRPYFLSVLFACLFLAK